MKIKRFYYSGMQKIYEGMSAHAASIGNVLMFHQVNDDQTKWETKGCSITSVSFRNLITELKQADCSFSPISMILNHETDEKQIFITFDDASRDVFTNAAPVLLENNIPFLIFLTTSYIDKDGYLSQSMIHELLKSELCTIGSHTVTHPMMRYLNSDSAMAELIQSKAILENTFGNKVEYFAFPYGSVYACSAENVRQASAAGYKLSFSTMSSSLTNNSIQEGKFLPRINMNEANYRDRGRKYLGVYIK